MKTILLSLSLAAVAAPTIAKTDDVKASAARQAEERLHTDWAWLGRYTEANAELPAGMAGPRVVFIGDSITQGWFDMAPTFFTDNNRIGRGIGGQTTPQMVLRFRQDVIDLKPAVVQIMAGTNDIAGNTGPMTPDQSKANIMTMAELARAHGIRVILASIPPAANFPWRPGGARRRWSGPRRGACERRCGVPRHPLRQTADRTAAVARARTADALD